MKHIHYEFYAYINETESGTMYQVVLVEVIDCDNEKKALKRAKELVVRPNYKLKKSWECKTCGIAEESLASQRYLTALLGKHLKNED